MENLIVSLLITTVGFCLTYFITKKPRLRFYYSAITQIPIPSMKKNESENDVGISSALKARFYRSHTIAISNQGNATAHNVRVGHYLLAPLAHSVSPEVNVSNPGNLKEILVPTLCAGEAFTISYLYPENIHFSNINSYLKCDEGMAEVANMKDVRIRSAFFRMFIQGIFFLGVLSAVNVCVKIAPILYKTLTI